MAVVAVAAYIERIDTADIAQETAMTTQSTLPTRTRLAAFVCALLSTLTMLASVDSLAHGDTAALQVAQASSTAGV